MSAQDLMPAAMLAAAGMALLRGNIAVFITSEAGVICWANAEACNVLGRADADLIGSQLNLFLSTQGEQVGSRSRHSSGGRAEILHPDGPLCSSYSATPFEAEDQTYVVWTLQQPGGVEDNAERKKLEAEHRAAEEKFFQLFRMSPVAKSLNDVEDGDRFVDVNEAFERATGFSRSEVLGKTPGELNFWQGKPEEMQAAYDLLRSGQLRNAEVPFRTKAGEVGTGLISAEMIEISGRRCCLVATLVITERKAAEEALRKSEERLRLTLEAADLVAFEVNANDGSLVEVGQVGRLFRQEPGFTHQGLASLLQNVYPEDRDSVRQAVEATFASGREYHLEYRIMAPGNELRWIGAYGTMRRDAAGNRTRLLGVAMDITQRKSAEQELVQANMRLQLAIDSGAIGIWEWNLLTGASLWDARVREIYGLTPGEIPPGLDEWKASVHPEDRERVAEAVRAALAGERKYDEEFRILRPDGTVRHVKAEGTVEWDGEGRAVRMVGVNRDITAFRQAEAERATLQAQLFQAQKMESVGRLAGGIAHDFNNLLTVINGYSAMAAGALAAGDPIRHQVEEIGRAGDRAATLTRQLLAFSRKQMLQPRILDLTEIVRNMHSMLARLVGDDVSVEFAGGGKLMVRIDPGQLEQVVMNLAINARDAMPGGGVLRIETTRKEWKSASPSRRPADRVGHYAVLSLIDNGTGMDEATKAQIFEPFFTTKPTGEGTGLGLSMVLGIVEQSGGWIEVASEPGRGSRFDIYLPHVEQPAAGVHTSGPRERAQGAERVLVVEDQPEVRRYMVTVLKSYGYQVYEASGPAQALSIIEREGQRIHLVLTDVVMPEMSGRELMARISLQQPGVRALFVSGYRENVVLGQGGPQRTMHYLGKPFSPEELALKIRAVLGTPA